MQYILKWETSKQDDVKILDGPFSEIEEGEDAIKRWAELVLAENGIINEESKALLEKAYGGNGYVKTGKFTVLFSGNSFCIAGDKGQIHLSLISYEEKIPYLEQTAFECGFQKKDGGVYVKKICDSLYQIVELTENPFGTDQKYLIKYGFVDFRKKEEKEYSIANKNLKEGKRALGEQEDFALSTFREKWMHSISAADEKEAIGRTIGWMKNTFILSDIEKLELEGYLQKQKILLARGYSEPVVIGILGKDGREFYCTSIEELTKGKVACKEICCLVNQFRKRYMNSTEKCKRCA